jgi:hypothetical protein
MQAALIVDAVVLAAVLEADLGGHRKITRSRLLRPVLVAAGIIPVFIEAIATHGNGLTLELVLGAVGIVLGLVATGLMKVFVSPETNKPVTRAGFAYGALWVVVIGARAAFTYGSSNWFGPQLDHWMVRNAVTSHAIIDGLIFMAVTMVLTRTIAMGVRARHLPTHASNHGARTLQAA